MTQYHHHKWPYSFSYFAASECNLACSHCYVEAGNPIPHRAEPLRAKGTFIDKLRGLGYAHVIFVGGEATLNPNIVDDVAFVLEAGLKPVIFSNGMDVPRELIEFAAGHPPTSFVLSMYGPAAVHDRFVRLEGAYARTRTTLEELCRRGIRVQINSAVNRFNAEGVFTLVRELEEFPVDWISLLYFSPFGWGKAISSLHFTPDEWNRYLDRYRALQRNPVNVYAELMFMRTSRYAELPRETKQRSACNVVKGERLCLDTAGNSFPCPMFAGRLQSHFHLHAADIDADMSPETAEVHAVTAVRRDFKQWVQSEEVQSRAGQTFAGKVFCPAHQGLLDDPADEERWTPLCPFFQEHLAGPELEGARQ